MSDETHEYPPCTGGCCQGCVPSRQRLYAAQTQLYANRETIQALNAELATVRENALKMARSFQADIAHLGARLAQAEGLLRPVASVDCDEAEGGKSCGYCGYSLPDCDSGSNVEDSDYSLTGPCPGPNARAFLAGAPSPAKCNHCRGNCACPASGSGRFTGVNERMGCIGGTCTCPSPAKTRTA